MSESYRMYANISFIAVLVFLGIPLWWKATEVYRVSLPYSRIEALDSISFKIPLTIQLTFKDTERASSIRDDLQKIYNSSDVFNLSFELVPLKTWLDVTPRALEQLDRGPGTLVLVESPRLKSHVHLTPFRVLLISEEASSSLIARVLTEWLLLESSVNSVLKSTAYARHDESTRRRAPPSRGFDIALTVASPSPDKIKVDWTPQEAIQEYLEPFVSELSAIHNFTLKSQWLYFVQLDFTPSQVRDNSPLLRHYALPADVLPHLITPLEMKLASHISKDPCLNLVLYTPPCEQAPIYIYYNQHAGPRAYGAMEAFLSPRWGGVVIGNPPVSVCQAYLQEEQTEIPVYRPPTREVMGYFLAQLRLLLGFPDQPPIPGATVDPLKSVSPRKWELDGLIRIKTIEQVISAKLTLKSLSQLLGKISNIVINDDVGASIYNAVENVERTGELLAQDGKAMEALRTSREAFLSAEAAFTDPTLLAQFGICIFVIFVSKLSRSAGCFPVRKFVCRTHGTESLSRSSSERRRVRLISGFFAKDQATLASVTITGAPRMRCWLRMLS